MIRGISGRITAYMLAACMHVEGDKRLIKVRFWWVDVELDLYSYNLRYFENLPLAVFRLTPDNKHKPTITKIYVVR